MREWFSLLNQEFHWLLGLRAVNAKSSSLGRENTTQAGYKCLFLLSQWPKSMGPTDVCFGFFALKPRAALVWLAVSLTNLLMDELASFLCGHLICQTTFSHTQKTGESAFFLNPPNFKQPNLDHSMIKSWNNLSSLCLPIFLLGKGEKRHRRKVKYKLWI